VKEVLKSLQEQGITIDASMLRMLYEHKVLMEIAAGTPALSTSDPHITIGP
jgi:hypothetical protein